jgi:hypothetical protein
MKVVSFSVWGKKRTYHEGVLENIALVKEHLPDWKVWVYTDGSSPEQSKMQDEGAELFIMPKAKDSGGAMWRFLPIGDKQVEVCLVRDSDTRINAHTAKGVEAFLASGKRGGSFFYRREHFRRPIVACNFSYKGVNGQFTWKAMKPVIETYDSWWRDELYLIDNLYESNKRSWQFFCHDPICVKNNLHRAKLWRPESEREDWTIVPRAPADTPFGMKTVVIDGKCEEDYFRAGKGHGKLANPE